MSYLSLPLTHHTNVFDSITGVCLCVCACVRTCVHMFVCVCVCVCVCARARVSASPCVRASVCVCTSVSVGARVFCVYVFGSSCKSIYALRISLLPDPTVSTSLAQAEYLAFTFSLSHDHLRQTAVHNVRGATGRYALLRELRLRERHFAGDNE